MSLYINTAINEDIQFIGYRFYESLGCKGCYLTAKGDVFAKGEGCRPELRDYPASSVKQILNLYSIINFLFKLPRGEKVYFLSPSPLIIAVIPLIFLMGVSFSALVHDVKPHYDGLRGRLYRLQNRLIFKWAESIYVFSSFSKSDASLTYPSSKAKKVVLPLPSPVEVDTGREHIVSSNEKEFDFVWWGRAEDYKGVGLLPVLASEIGRAGKSLLVVGNFSSYPLVKEDLSSAENVTFIDGFVETRRLADLVSKCRINLCPYLSATQSGVVAFCACLGVPSIVSRVGGLPEQALALGGRVLDGIEQGVFDVDSDAVSELFDVMPGEVKRRYDDCCSALAFTNVLKGSIK